MRSNIRRPMSRASDVSEALATLQARWGSAAPRRGGTAEQTDRAPARAIAPAPVEDETDDEPRGPVVGPDPSPRPTPAPAPSAPAPSRPGQPAADAEGR